MTSQCLSSPPRMSRKRCRFAQHVALAVIVALVASVGVAVPAVGWFFDLAGIDGTNGLLFNGEDGQNSGLVIAAAGDVNGDGLADLLIGGGFFSERAYLVFGTREGSDTPISLGELDGTDGVGFFVDGALESIAGVGDLNGDGFDDLLFGDRNADIGPVRSGAAYVVYGAPELPARITLDSLGAEEGFRLDGVELNDSTGNAVGSAGDFNGDGHLDLIIGAFAWSLSDSPGKAYIVFGHEDGFPDQIDLGSLDGSNGFTFVGEEGLQHCGAAVSTVGDLNADGFDDVFIGVDDDPTVGYLVFGTDDELSAEIGPVDLEGTVGVTFVAPFSYHGAGTTISGGGDLNGDGIADMVIGAPNATTKQFAEGRAIVVWGRREPFPASIALASLDGELGFRVNGPDTGSTAADSLSLLPGSDINGDGLDDLFIGAGYGSVFEDEPGDAFVVFGSREPFPADLELGGGLDHPSGIKLLGARKKSDTGDGGAVIGDFNGDGMNDLAVGAPRFGDTDEFDSNGRVYLVFGRHDLGL